MLLSRTTIKLILTALCISALFACEYSYDRGYCSLCRESVDSAAAGRDSGGVEAGDCCAEETGGAGDLDGAPGAGGTGATTGGAGGSGGSEAGLDSGADSAADARHECVKHEECAAPTPACDKAKGKCVPCVKEGGSHVGCSKPTPICKTATDSPDNQCVECLSSADDCANPEPICESDACRACTDDNSGDSECADLSAATPACAGGSCMECNSRSHGLCVGTKPVCDADDHACRACEAHSECDSAGGVCNWSTGGCLSESEVIYVDNAVGSNCDDLGNGESKTPFCALQVGVDEAAAGRNTILVNASTYDPINLTDTNAIWIVGESGSEVKGKIADEAVVYLSGDTQLTVEGLKIYYGLGKGEGIKSVGTTSNPSLTVRDCEISGNGGIGISATSSTVTVEASAISGNTGGGVSLTSCNFELTNNMIVANGASTVYGGVRITTPGTTAIFSYNTVAGNFASATNPAGIRCDDPVDIRSSIVYGNSNAELSSSCAPYYSLIEDGTGTSGDIHNLTGDPSFMDAANGNYHLKTSPASQCIDKADSSSYPDHDFEGDHRPTGAGPDIGADEAG